MENNVTYSENIRDMILVNLDGWRIGQSAETADIYETIDPFMTEDEAVNKANKVITEQECQLFYEEALDLAFVHTNRLNIDDLNTVEARLFLRGVCKWAASNLWNKYNIRVNNEDMEDTYVQSYGGLLYKSALNALKPFINQRFSGLSSFRQINDDTDDVWKV